jgi:hypothetical protein
MTQHTKIRRPTPEQAPAALACPACDMCGAATRFVGLETIADNDSADLCTYQCIACGHAQASVIPRSGATDGKASATHH